MRVREVFGIKRFPAPANTARFWGTNSKRKHPWSTSFVKNSSRGGEQMYLHENYDFHSKVRELKEDGGGKFSGTYEILTYAKHGRTYGNFNMVFDVEVCVKEDGSYKTTSGSVTASDTYDFNAASHRSTSAESDVSKMRALQQTYNLSSFDTKTKTYEIYGEGKALSRTGYIEKK